MNSYTDIWLDLESTHLLNGYKFRLLPNESSVEIFLGVKFPNRDRFIGIKVPSRICDGYTFNFQLNGLKVERVQDEFDSSSNLINLVLTDSTFSDLFDSVIFDIFNFLRPSIEKNIALKRFMERIKTWQSCFEGKIPEGLNQDEQQGLFGELVVLRVLLNSGIPPLKAFESWVGGKKKPRDFQLKDWALEVKTSSGSGPFKLKINGERQLDSHLFNELFLYHIVLESMIDFGESLPDIVAEIKTTLADVHSHQNEFKLKLKDWRYEDQHVGLYSKTTYVIRSSSIYKIEKDFPRIEEQDLRAGVGEVAYSISVSGLSQYLSNIESLTLRLKANE